MRSSKPQQGKRTNLARPAMVLVLVLIVVVMIALAGFSFAELMLTENKATHLHGDELRLQQALGSGIEYLKLYCEQPLAERELAGGSEHNPELFRGIGLLPEDRSARVPQRQVRFSVLSPAHEMAPGQSFPGVRFGLENESGRLYLGDLLNWERQQPGSGRQALMKLPGMTDAVADAILDWLDTDSTARAMGAEHDYYAGLEPGYAPRNGLPENLEELLLVKGVTRELLLGLDANYNYRIDPEELIRPAHSAHPRRTTASQPWAALLTLHSGQRNTRPDGRPRVNLNDTNMVALRQQLTAALDANWAAFIIAYRQYGPYAGDQSPQSGPPPIKPSLAPRFQVRSPLDFAGVRVAVPSETSGQPPKVYLSPMPGEPQAMATALAKLMDATTVAPLPVIRGGVSVNHAPAAVLRLVPGIDDTLAERIIAARRTNENPSARRHATWLLTEGLVDLERMKLLLPYLNGGGEVMRAQLVAHTDKPGPTARAEVLIDATSRPAQIVFWRDLRLWGAGFPPHWLSDAAAEMAAAAPPRPRATAEAE